MAHETQNEILLKDPGLQSKNSTDRVGLFSDKHDDFWTCPHAVKMRRPCDADAYRIGIQQLVEKQVGDRSALVRQKQRALDFKKNPN